MSTTLLGPKTGIVDILIKNIEDDLQKDKDNKKHFQRTPIRPSAAGKCPRELYFELMEYSGRASYPTDIHSGETDLLLNLGHSIEHHLIGKMRRHFKGIEIKYTQQSLDFGQVETINDQKLAQHIEGSTDLVFWSEEWKCCADIKSKGDNYDFSKRKMKWESDNEKLSSMKSVEKVSSRCFWVNDLPSFLIELKDPFFEANFRQLNMYLNSDFLKSRNVEFGSIIQYHKSKSKLREIRFRPSAQVHNEVMDKFRNVIKAVDENRPELAPATFPSESFKARYCNFCKAGVPGSCANKNGK